MDTKREWSRDWTDFEKDPIFTEMFDLQGEDRDVRNLGISPEEVEEYCEWLSINKPQVFRQLKERMQRINMEDLGIAN